VGRVRIAHQARFPERPIVDIPDDDPIFHTVYDVTDRYQVPGQAHLRVGYKYADGKGAHWRGIYDDQGRVMVAISFNSDLGDAWEWADDPWYPAKFSDLAVPPRRQLCGLRHDALRQAQKTI